MTNTSLLLGSARAGDTHALDTLFAHHRGRLLAFARGRMSAGLAAKITPDDIVQETLLEASRRLPDFESRGPASFYRWLVGIARYKLLEAARAQRAKKRALEAPLERTPLSERTGVSGGVLRRERADLVHAGLCELPDRQGEAVRLRYLEGASVQEAAEELGCTPSALKKLVARGMAGLADRLRAHLQETTGAAGPRRGEAP